MSFDPRVPEIGEGGRAVTRVAFSRPGVYVLQAVADDTVYVSPCQRHRDVKPAAGAP